MTDEDEQKHQKESHFPFSATPEQLKSLAEGSAEFLATAKDEDLGEFVEDEESPNGQEQTCTRYGVCFLDVSNRVMITKGQEES